ncbi:PREDICTED: guanylate-binding protein 6-like [Chinchilla lanigera]|uniref:guanylate-binding protein 6-like n=1 Tax=Chinchilla lanigera TaxID=34839 RepID=UPI00038EC471|nr:PREDICTED: guanylate-binding protein 6-like [Chinchilla lanigera]
MASELKMVAPICLVENIREEMKVNREAIEILEKISQPVVVVAIVGLYRTGKSYLMNRLAGQNHGFPLRSTVQSKTKGIWMWCLPHPIKPDLTLVLLDTEGLGDMEKGDPRNDSWIFALALLLSSTFVYNSVGTINCQALEQLHYVTELTELIKAKSSSNSDGVQDSTEFVSFFPDFIWAVRDFTLQLKLGDHFITADQYLDNALKLIPGSRAKSGCGISAGEVLQRFLQSQVAIEESILQSDKALTDRERDMAVEKAKNEAAQKGQEISTAKEQELQQVKAALERTHKENMEQLEKKLLLERENLLRDQKMMFEQLMKFQKDLLEEGFNKKSEAMNAELKRLKSRIKAIESSNEPFITRALNIVGEGIIELLGTPGEVLGKAVKYIGSFLK